MTAMQRRRTLQLLVGLVLYAASARDAERPPDFFDAPQLAEVRARLDRYVREVAPAVPAGDRTFEADGTTVWPRVSKKRRNRLRISALSMPSTLPKPPHPPWVQCHPPHGHRKYGCTHPSTGRWLWTDGWHVTCSYREGGDTAPTGVS